MYRFWACVVGFAEILSRLRESSVCCLRSERFQATALRPLPTPVPAYGSGGRRLHFILHPC